MTLHPDPDAAGLIPAEPAYADLQAAREAVAKAVADLEGDTDDNEG